MRQAGSRFFILNIAFVAAMCSATDKTLFIVAAIGGAVSVFAGLVEALEAER